MSLDSEVDGLVLGNQEHSIVMAHCTGHRDLQEGIASRMWKLLLYVFAECAVRGLRHSSRAQTEGSRGRKQDMAYPVWLQKQKVYGAFILHTKTSHRTGVVFEGVGCSTSCIGLAWSIRLHRP